MDAAERAYSLLLRAYPAAFRAAFGREMRLAFRDARRDGRRGVVWWGELVLDVARSAPPLHAEQVRARLRSPHHTEGTMKPMAMLAMAIGALEVVNSLVELYLGGIVLHDGVSMGAGVLGVVAGMLLALAGLALLRGGSSGATWAQGAAVACLLAFILIGVALPRLSGAAMLFGVAFPIVLVLFVRIGGGRGTHAAA